MKVLNVDNSLEKLTAQENPFIGPRTRGLTWNSTGRLYVHFKNTHTLGRGGGFFSLPNRESPPPLQHTRTHARTDHAPSEPRPWMEALSSRIIILLFYHGLALPFSYTYVGCEPVAV